MKVLLMLSILSISICNQYQNPVVHLERPDPGVLRIDTNNYVVVATGVQDNNAFPIMHSSDLVNWELKSYVFQNGNFPSWACCDFWAPEIHQWSGNTYHIYFTSRHSQTKFLSLGVARSFTGPYGPYSLEKEPLLTQSNYGIIDAHFVRNPKDGIPYLVWKDDGNDRGQPTPIYIQKLDQKEGMTLYPNDHPIELIRNDQTWESICTEGPWIEYNSAFDYYYLFYSGNMFNTLYYSVGVARSKTITGPYQKRGEPILHQNVNGKFYGTGHNSITQDNTGRWWIVYHAYNTQETQVGRQMLLDSIEWTGDGWPFISNDSPSTQPRDGPI